MMAKVTGTFSATGQSGHVQITEQYGDLHVSGTFTATIQLERSFDKGATWVPVTKDGTAIEITGPFSEKILGSGPDCLHRLRCTAYTSGTATYFLG